MRLSTKAAVCAEALARLAKRQTHPDFRRDVVGCDELHEPGELLEGSHCRAYDSNLFQKQPRHVGAGIVSTGHAHNNDRACATDPLEGMRPGCLAYGFHHRIDPTRQRLACREGAVRAKTLG